MSEKAPACWLCGQPMREKVKAWFNHASLYECDACEVQWCQIAPHTPKGEVISIATLAGPIDGVQVIDHGATYSATP